MKKNKFKIPLGIFTQGQLALLSLFTFLLLSIVSCEKDHGPVVVRPPAVIDTTHALVSYRGYIQPIFNDYCIACHTSSHPFLDLRGIVSYDELLYTGASAPYVDSINPDNSLLIQRLIGDEWPIMPPDPPYLTAAQIDSVRLWMLQGYKDN